MRSNHLFAPAAWTAIAFFVLTGCLKPHDLEILHNEGFKFCPIQQLNVVAGEFNSPTIKITYNAAGNPTDMLDSGFFNPTEIEYHFRYDKFNRLTDYYMNYRGAGGGIIWHRYSYRDARTIVDTSYDYVGDINSPDPPHSSFDTKLDIYKLDDLGRIIKDIPVNTISDPAGDPIDYAYDDKGDLINSGVTYDDKINLFQTNNVWSFIYKDYSLHNPLQSKIFSLSPMAYPDYNSIGLPLEIDSPGAYLFGDAFLVMGIKYACDAGQKK